AVARTFRDDDGWQIRVTGRPPGPAAADGEAGAEAAAEAGAGVEIAIDIEVRARRTPQRQLTCRGPATSSAVVYEAVSVRQR
ncbi:hypothetical protein GT040_31995, partial [Streptomyces sp. SID2119]|nr:hypothetical protein [Streptomyces sp. SID2119]